MGHQRVFARTESCEPSAGEENITAQDASLVKFNHEDSEACAIFQKWKWASHKEKKNVISNFPTPTTWELHDNGWCLEKTMENLLESHTRALSNVTVNLDIKPYKLKKERGKQEKKNTRWAHLPRVLVKFHCAGMKPE